MFSPLSKAYSAELSKHLYRSQGLITVKKGDFLPLFEPSWITSFTSKNILKAFEATGVVPADAEVIVQRFRTPTPEQDEGPETRKQGDRDSWRQLRILFDAAVKDGSEVKAKQLSASLHSL
jgi:hypothetical protein